MFLGVIKVILSELLANLRCQTINTDLLSCLGDEISLGLILRETSTATASAWRWGLSGLDQGRIGVRWWLDHGDHAWGSTTQGYLSWKCRDGEQDVHIVGVEDLTQVSIHFINLINLEHSGAYVHLVAEGEGLDEEHGVAQFLGILSEIQLK
jgi:hypothetical protein